MWLAFSRKMSSSTSTRISVNHSLARTSAYHRLIWLQYGCGWYKLILVCHPLAVLYLANKSSNSVGLYISAGSRTAATTMMLASARLPYTVVRAQTIRLSDSLFSCGRRRKCLSQRLTSSWSTQPHRISRQRELRRGRMEASRTATDFDGVQDIKDPAFQKIICCF